MYRHFSRPTKARGWMTIGGILILSILVALIPALVIDVAPLASQNPAEGPIGIRSVQLVNFGLVGNDESFQIRIFCSEAFQVNGVYATVRDPDGTVDIDYVDVVVLGRIFSGDFAPPFSWAIQHVPFDPAGGDSSTTGYELLSQLQVEKPIGVPYGGSFDIFGFRTSTDLGPDSNDTLSVGAVVETAQDPENVCSIVIVDH